MKRSKLTGEVKTFIVQALAAFDTPSVVVAAVKEAFGIDIARQSVERYDPTKRAGRRLSPKLRAIFAASREKFVADTASIGVAHRTVRLKRIERLIDKAESSDDIGMAAELLKQAAKEVGDVYTNRRRIDDQARTQVILNITGLGNGRDLVIQGQAIQDEGVLQLD